VNKNINFRGSVIILAFAKILTVSISFALYPLALRILSVYEYGVWLTLSSVLTWFAFFDFGIGNTFRTLLTSSIEAKSYELAREIVASLYLFFILVFIPTAIVLTVLSFYVNWKAFFKVQSIDDSVYRLIFVLMISGVIVKLIFENIFILLAAVQKTYIQGVYFAVSSLLVFVTLLVLESVKFPVNITAFVAINTFIPLVCIVLLNVYVYRAMYSVFWFRISDASFRLIKNSLVTSGYFFLIQIMYLLIFSTDNIIITKIFGVGEAAIYSTSFKYFSVITIAFTTVMTPLWPTFTVYYERRDRKGLAALFKKIFLLWLCASIVAVVMLFGAPFCIEKWIGDKITVPFKLNLGMCFFIIVSTWCMIFGTFLNSINQIKLQALVSVATGLMNIPLSILLAQNTYLGSSGVIYATCFCLLISAIILPFETRKYILKLQIN
jgi:O-antigen/teichoic acid export membrane protein